MCGQATYTPRECNQCGTDTDIWSYTTGPNHSFYCGDCRQQNPYCHTCKGPTHLYVVTESGAMCLRCYKTLTQCEYCGVAGLEKYWSFDCGASLCEKHKDERFGECWQCGERSLLRQTDFCDDCDDTIVTELSHGLDILDEVTEFLDRQFSLRVTFQYDFQIVTKSEALNLFPDEDWNGIWFHDRRMYIRKGLAEDIFRGVVAHEFAHAWQTEHAPRNLCKELSEGFARWVQWKVLYELYADFAAELLEESEQEFYGPGLRKALQWEKILGEEGLIEAMREWTEFPPIPQVKLAA